MLLLYIVYIVVMYFNPTIGEYLMDKVNKLKEKWNSSKTHSQNQADEKAPLLTYNPELYVDQKDPDQTTEKERDNLLQPDDQRSRSGSKYSENIGFEHHSHALCEYSTGAIFTKGQVLPKIGLKFTGNVSLHLWLKVILAEIQLMFLGKVQKI